MRENCFIIFNGLAHWPWRYTVHKKIVLKEYIIIIKATAAAERREAWKNVRIRNHLAT